MNRRVFLEGLAMKPIEKRCVRARQKGADAYRAGKKMEDNPYLADPLVALSSWWQTGYIQAKNEGTDN